MIEAATCCESPCQPNLPRPAVLLSAIPVEVSEPSLMMLIITFAVVAAVNRIPGFGAVRLRNT